VSEFCIVLTTASDPAVVQRLIDEALGGRLAACVQVLPMMSHYRWQGQIEQAEEVTLLIKTTREKYAQLQQTLVDAHPYDVPEVIAWPLSEGYAPYLHWVVAETTSEKHA